MFHPYSLEYHSSSLAFTETFIFIFFKFFGKLIINKIADLLQNYMKSSIRFFSIVHPLYHLIIYFTYITIIVHEMFHKNRDAVG